MFPFSEAAMPHDHPVTPESSARAPDRYRHASETGARSASSSALLALITRLHFYIGLFVGPFLFVAALSGIVYALTPQLENALYAHALRTPKRGPALPLSRQIDAARAQAGADARLVAVRPAPAPGTTTRVMFARSDFGPSQSRALFVDPVSGEVRGDMEVYGTSGVLPLRSLLDRFHRGLLLGEPGRVYSELAASWLWIAALGGLVLWLARRRARRPASDARPRQALRRWHEYLGLLAMIGLLFFSATGLTWSKWAGDNIGLLRARYGWSTPSVSTRLVTPAGDARPAMPAGSDGAMAGMAGMASMPGMHHMEHGDATAMHHMDAGSAPGGEHAEHMAMTAVGPAPAATFDAVLRAARQAGIASPQIEIRPGAPGKAWTVSEIDRRWPTHVDAAAVDPKSLRVTDVVRFRDYPLAAKLTRWGIDAHMGTLFGLFNQLLLIAAALGLLAMVVLGYLMWWQRRPTRASRVPRSGPFATLKRLPWPTRCVVLALAVALGVALPVFGASLLLFVLCDAVLCALPARRMR